MEFIPADSSSVAFFILIQIAVLGAVLGGVYFAHIKMKKPAGRATLRLALGMTIWIVCLSAVVKSGFLETSPMPRMMLFLGFINIVSVAVALSPVGQRLSVAIPVGFLVGFQGFRLPLELVLHSWVQQGVIPATMTWSGSNFDIASGVLALLMAPFAQKYRPMAWVFNFVGFVLLLNVVRVAVLSSPLPFAWPVKPVLQLAFHLPYALIIPVCIGGAFFGHVVLTRALLSGPEKY